MASDGIRLIIEAVFFVAGMLIIGALGFYAVAAARRKAPASWQQMEDRYDRQQRRLDDALERLDAAFTRIDQLEAEMDDMRDERDADHELMQEWIAYARSHTARLKALTGEEPPPEPQARPKRRRNGRVTLARLIANRFSVDEIDGLAYDFGLAKDELTGDTREARARALAQWASDRDRLADLQRRVEELRPHNL